MSVSEVARAALLESAPADHVGGQIDSTPIEDGVTTVAFECANPGYPGWYWAVTVVTLDGTTTVSEVNLLPGADALVPPAWKPWSTRVRSGDLGVGDLLATEPTDARLTAGFSDVPEDLAVELSGTQWELGLGREQVLSVMGMDLAVERWLAGQNGPRAAMAKAAPAPCSTCGFLVAVGGSLGRAFGVCGNEFGAADGQLVAMSFGCGAHSSVRIDHIPPVAVVDLVIDDDADALADASGLPDAAVSEDGSENGPTSAGTAAARDAADASDEADDDRDDDPDGHAQSHEADDEDDVDHDDHDDDHDDDEEEEDDEPDSVDGDYAVDYLEHIDDESMEWNPDR